MLDMRYEVLAELLKTNGKTLRKKVVLPPLKATIAIKKRFFIDVK